MDYPNVFEKVVVPLDGSHWAERAIPHAEQIARSGGGELILVHIYRPSGSEYRAEATLAMQTSHLTQARQNAEAYVKGIQSKLSGQKIRIRAHVIEGTDLATLFCDFVNSEGADLVVMPTAGHNRLMRVILGDLTARVRGCINACLLLVRGDLEAEWDESSRKVLEAQAAAQHAASEAAADTASPSSALLLEQLVSLRDAGILSDDEFQLKKSLVLARG